MPASRCYSFFITILLDFYVGPTAKSRIMDLSGILIPALSVL